MRASRVCVLLCNPLYTSMKRITQSDLQQSKLIEYIISIYLCEDHPSIKDNSNVSNPLQYLDRDRTHLLLPHLLRSFICNPPPLVFFACTSHLEAPFPRPLLPLNAGETAAGACATGLAGTLQLG